VNFSAGLGGGVVYIKKLKYKPYYIIYELYIKIIKINGILSVSEVILYI